jgi:hypothetical protein
MLSESRTRKLGGLRVTVQLNIRYLWLDVLTHNAQYLKPLIERKPDTQLIGIKEGLLQDFSIYDRSCSLYHT